MELLIVISIIGILISLLMPAVQSAQESGRRAQCASNLRQMALGCLSHESKYKCLPSGGWGYQWGGEPDRGFGRLQPGGWHFNILPFIDQVDLHDMGKGLGKAGDTVTSNTARFNAGTTMAETVVAVFICPTRRRVQIYPDDYPNDLVNINPYPVIARSDYAANAGSLYTTAGVDPGNANSSYSPTFDWSTVPGSVNSTSEASTGVIFRASECTTAMIKDGVSNTYMIGERYLCPDAYFVGSYCDNDQGWDQGYDYDTVRGTMDPPSQDRPGLCGCMITFGSAHEAGFNMAFCDGVVRLINFSIDPLVHSQLGHRSDGEPTDLSGINARK